MAARLSWLNICHGIGETSSRDPQRGCYFDAPNLNKKASCVLSGQVRIILRCSVSSSCNQAAHTLADGRYYAGLQTIISPAVEGRAPFGQCLGQHEVELGVSNVCSPRTRSTPPVASTKPQLRPIFVVAHARPRTASPPWPRHA